LSDVHVSLANQGHLHMYIQQARKAMFPEGTGWAGSFSILELDASNFALHIEDDADVSLDGSPLLKIIVCMSQEGSQRLLKAQYLQSNISFKQVVGYREFALACLDRDSNTSVVFCCVFLNRETAVAHQHVFSEVEKLVKQDTGQSLHWHHLHASMIDDYDNGILQWTADAHKGQAKGLGLHLQTLAQRTPDIYDLHEPDRLLCDLTPYDYLHCVFQLCKVHFLKVSEMLCKVSYALNIQTGIRHSILFALRAGTLAIVCSSFSTYIKTEQAPEWVKNKIDSHFMLEAMCWELNFIPLDIWMSGKANNNLVESTHFNINLEGKSYTLVGGIETGQRFDSTKMATLRVCIKS
ncbi:hypothetical protein EDD85DRAFT_769017, partial [Armillaria nabsnona]